MNLNIYINGVGGQGVGVLAAMIGEIFFDLGYKVIGSDTHGLAQRHGSVSSHIRIGEFYYPLIEKNSADFVLSLERLEALRASEEYLKPNGTLIFYDSIYQPALVRIGSKKYPDMADLKSVCDLKKSKMIRIKIDQLRDYRKQNVAILSVFIRELKNISDEKVLPIFKKYVKYDLEENIKIYNLSKNIN
ncbi:MAG: 2-oxoacid:acceptor oxidoreductase family protein [Elusimicrobiales bacterium]|nr:2-oxoacid:acceptor oxidoreductase family protein [Elusimicrobiales bacterium]